MSKRKEVGDNDMRMRGEEEDSEDEDLEIVDVDFEFFDLETEIDFHGLKSLFRQLLDVDAQLFDLTDLVDLILSKPCIGTTIKCDGKESDPYAFLTLLDPRKHQDKAYVTKLVEYLEQKSSTIPSLTQLSSMLSTNTKPRVGIVLTERLINMPPKVIPPMYVMLIDELSKATQADQSADFSHYLIISKVYKEVESKLDQQDRKSAKKSKMTPSNDTFYFHPEDEVFQQFTSGHGAFEYTTQRDEGEADSKRAFWDMGIVPQGYLMLIESAKFQEAVNKVKDFLDEES